jgi:hypothetical protein
MWMLRNKNISVLFLMELVPCFPTSVLTDWDTPALFLTLLNNEMISALQRVYLFHQQVVPTFGTKLLPLVCLPWAPHTNVCISFCCRSTKIYEYKLKCRCLVDRITKVNVKIIRGLCLTAVWLFTYLCALLPIILLHHWHIHGIPWPYTWE